MITVEARRIFYLIFRFGLLMLPLIIIIVSVPRPVHAYSGGYALDFDGINDWIALGGNDVVFNAPGGYPTPQPWESTKTVSVWVRPEGTAVTCQVSRRDRSRSRLTPSISA